MGAYYVARARYDEAAKLFKQVIALAPENYRAYSNLGAVYLRLGKNDEALSNFEKSLLLKPNYVAASNLGTLSFFRGDFEGSIKAFDQALQIDPSNYMVWANLGSALTKTGNSARAKQAYSKAVILGEEATKLNPRDAKLVVDLASYYASLGENSKSTALLTKALRLAPENTSVLLIAATTYSEIGKRDEALKLLAQAIDRGLPLKDIQQSVALAPLRSDPRYAALEKRVSRQTAGARRSSIP